MIEDINRVVRIDRDKAFIEVERTSAYARCRLQEVVELVGGRRRVHGSEYIKGKRR